MAVGICTLLNKVATSCSRLGRRINPGAPTPPQHESPSYPTDLIRATTFLASREDHLGQIRDSFCVRWTRRPDVYKACDSSLSVYHIALGPRGYLEENNPNGYAQKLCWKDDSTMPAPYRLSTRGDEYLERAVSAIEKTIKEYTPYTKPMIIGVILAPSVGLPGTMAFTHRGRNSHHEGFIWLRSDIPSLELPTIMAHEVYHVVQFRSCQYFARIGSTTQYYNWWIEGGATYHADTVAGIKVNTCERYNPSSPLWRHSYGDACWTFWVKALTFWVKALGLER